MSSGAMFERDAASAGLGMAVVELSAGYATVRMAIREDMINGHGVTHGGFVFALADTAFALACNDGAAVTLAAGADITFLRSTRLGQVLTASAAVKTSSGRSGIYDVTVTDESGDVVAEFRGRSRTVSRPAA
jgi:acyl-CoA thioesterase